MLVRAGSAAVFPALASGCRSGCTAQSAPGPGKTLSARAWAVVEAATARLVPSDDLPGAREANVVGFIDAELAAPHFRSFHREIERGSVVLDGLATKRFGRGFVACTGGQQDEILAAVQGGEGAEEDLAPAHFFQVLLTLTLEGLLGDPVHGGNRDEAGWKLIGYAPREPRPHGDHHG